MGIQWSATSAYPDLIILTIIVEIRLTQVIRKWIPLYVVDSVLNGSA